MDATRHPTAVTTLLLRPHSPAGHRYLDKSPMMAISDTSVAPVLLRAGPAACLAAVPRKLRSEEDLKSITPLCLPGRLRQNCGSLRRGLSEVALSRWVDARSMTNDRRTSPSISSRLSSQIQFKAMAKLPWNFLPSIPLPALPSF